MCPRSGLAKTAAGAEHVLIIVDIWRQDQSRKDPPGSTKEDIGMGTQTGAFHPGDGCKNKKTLWKASGRSQNGKPGKTTCPHSQVRCTWTQHGRGHVRGRLCMRARRRISDGLTAEQRRSSDGVATQRHCTHNELAKRAPKVFA